MRAAIGLRHPASASCLGRHLRLAGRCPNNSSLFPPLAAVVVVALWAYSAEKLFVICKSGKSADFPDLLFHGWGRGRKQQLQKSPHDTDLKSKRQQGQLVGALKDTSTQLSRSVLNTAKDAQEVSSDASIAQENVKNKCQPERRGSKERTLSGAPPLGELSRSD